MNKIRNLWFLSTLHFFGLTLRIFGLVNSGQVTVLFQPKITSLFNTAFVLPTFLAKVRYFLVKNLYVNRREVRRKCTKAKRDSLTLKK